MALTDAALTVSTGRWVGRHIDTDSRSPGLDRGTMVVR